MSSLNIERFILVCKVHEQLNTECLQKFRFNAIGQYGISVNSFSEHIVNVNRFQYLKKIKKTHEMKAINRISLY